MSESTELLYDYQRDAINRMRNGKILCGGVGSGKSRTSLAYYFEKNGGIFDRKRFKEMRNPKNLLIITTAQKRDKKEWEHEMVPFRLSTKEELNYYKNKVIVDSWHNITKYKDLEGWDIIFDEQHLNGKGKWVNTFLKMAKHNDWIVLTATPGDDFISYVPIWVANGYFKNRSEFLHDHCVYNNYSPYPKIDKYIGVRRLLRLRDNVIVHMDYTKRNMQHHEYMECEYDILAYKAAHKNRWNPFKNEPMENASELCYVLRKIVNLDVSRQIMLLEMFEDHPKIIIFYNFDDERDILLKLCEENDIEVAEWTGHAHQPVPTGEKWAYLCQYNSAAEGWNATTTDTIVFYSQNYSYKTMVQAAGRIDRMNTPFRDLYYYHFISSAPIDLAIRKALKRKKNFNEGKFANW